MVVLIWIWEGGSIRLILKESKIEILTDCPSWLFTENNANHFFLFAKRGIPLLDIKVSDFIVWIGGNILNVLTIIKAKEKQEIRISKPQQFLVFTHASKIPAFLFIFTKRRMSMPYIYKRNDVYVWPSSLRPKLSPQKKKEKKLMSDICYNEPSLSLLIGISKDNKTEPLTLSVFLLYLSTKNFVGLNTNCELWHLKQNIATLTVE